PQVTTAETGNVRVNSVGTIIPPVVPVATKDETAIPETVENDEKAKVAEVAKVENVDDKTKKETTEKTEPPKYEVAITDDLKVAEPVALPPPVRKNVRRRTRAKRPPVKTKLETVSKAEEVIDPLKTDTDSEPVPANKATAVKKKEAKPDPLANVQLVIVFRDGRRIERPLPEVFRFTVDRGILTVVSKDGRVGKYSMIDVLKVTIE
ncbi:MAG: hypothetical protein ACRD6X_15405, partial [Pyrinomonadaceae bacterium]